MDANAFGLCKANQLPIVVFNINEPGAIARILAWRAGWDHRPMSTIPELVKHGREQMAKAVDSTQRELGTIRSGKASPALLDLVRVEAYGAQVPLNQVAMVAAPEPRLLTVQPFDKALAPVIEKAIRDADLGLNPASQGNLIRVPLPALSEERRKELVKVVHKLARGRPHRRAARAHRRARQDQEARARPRGRQDARGEGRAEAHRRARQARSTSMIKAKEAEIMEV